MDWAEWQPPSILASQAFCQHNFGLRFPFEPWELAMPVATKTQSEHIVIGYACGAVGDLGDCNSTTQANSVIRELARALARMAAREDDAKENGV
jgi:hypothetical protein